MVSQGRDTFIILCPSPSHLEVILSPRGHLAMSFLVVLSGRVLLASGGQRDASKYRAMHKASPPQ